MQTITKCKRCRSPTIFTRVEQSARAQNTPKKNPKCFLAYPPRSFFASGSRFRIWKFIHANKTNNTSHMYRASLYKGFQSRIWNALISNKNYHKSNRNTNYNIKLIQVLLSQTITIPIAIPTRMQTLSFTNYIHSSRVNFSYDLRMLYTIYLVACYHAVYSFSYFTICKELFIVVHSHMPNNTIQKIHVQLKHE